MTGSCGLTKNLHAHSKKSPQPQTHALLLHGLLPVRIPLQFDRAEAAQLSFHKFDRCLMIRDLREIFLYGNFIASWHKALHVPRMRLQAFMSILFQSSRFTISVLIFLPQKALVEANSVNAQRSFRLFHRNGMKVLSSFELETGKKSL